MNLFCLFPTIVKLNEWMWGVLSYAQHCLCFSDVTDIHTSTQCHINGEYPQSPKAFHYLCPVIPAHYISSLSDGA